MNALADARVVLILGGGNALGAFAAGAYCALHDRGVLPHWVIGASAGAVNGAVIAGNPPEDRVQKLRSLWGVAKGSPPIWPANWLETMRRTAAASAVIVGGYPPMFVPRLPIEWDGGRDGHPGLYDTAALAKTIASAADFDCLNRGETRFTATAVDLESGEDRAFDTRDQKLTPDHIRASAALPPIFPPVTIDGRTYVDAGVSANLPLDPFLQEQASGPTLALGIDLLPLASPPPTSVGELASRAQDLLFAAQSRRSLARWEAAYRGREDASITLVHLRYTAQEHEVAGKAFDFSAETLSDRWASGADRMHAVLDSIANGRIALGRRG